jgi:hypothetical protein
MIKNLISPSVPSRKLWAGRDPSEREQSSAELANEELPIVNDIRQTGVQINAVWDLVNWRGSPYPEAIPALLKHLPLPYSDRLAEGIARALARSFARDLAWDIVLDLYRKEPLRKGAWFKDGLAVALLAMARPTDIPVLIELFDDRRHGHTRGFFALKFARSKSPAALEALIRHRNDPDFAPEIERILKNKTRSLRSKTRPQ